MLRILWLTLILVLGPSGLAAECRYDWECRVVTFPECRPDGCSPPCGIHPTGVAAVPYGGIQDFMRTMQEEAQRRCPAELTCQKCVGELKLPDPAKYHARCDRGTCRLAQGPDPRRTERTCERDSDCILNWTGCCEFTIAGRKYQKAPTVSSGCRQTCEGLREPPMRLACAANQCVPDGVRKLALQPRSEPTSKPPVAPPPGGVVPGSDGGGAVGSGAVGGGGSAVGGGAVGGGATFGACIHSIKPNIFQVIVRDGRGGLVTEASVFAMLGSKKRYSFESLGTGFYLAKDLPEGIYHLTVRWGGKMRTRRNILRKKVVYGGCPSSEGFEPATVEVKLD